MSHIRLRVLCIQNMLVDSIGGTARGWHTGPTPSPDIFYTIAYRAKHYH